MTLLPNSVLVPIVTAAGPFYDHIISLAKDDLSTENLAGLLTTYDEGQNSDLYSHLLSQWTTLADVKHLGYPIEHVVIDQVEYIFQQAPDIPAISLYRTPTTYQR